MVFRTLNSSYYDNYTHGSIEDHIYLWDFELHFDPRAAAQWLTRHRPTVWLCVVVYILAVYFGQRAMKNRAPFKLRGPLIIWNGCLAVFSIIVAIRLNSDLWNAWAKNNFQYTVCFYSQNSATQLWSFYFTLTKILELGDTAFIVLRKQKLIFLHWYHHITVLLFTYYSACDIQAMGRWFATVNATVHAFMYLYYLITISGYRLPKLVQMALTSMQLIQMVVGCYITYFTHHIISKSVPCQVDQFYVNAAALMYFSYLILFANFFCQTYIFSSKQYSQKKIN